MTVRRAAAVFLGVLAATGDPDDLLAEPQLAPLEVDVLLAQGADFTGTEAAVGHDENLQPVARVRGRVRQSFDLGDVEWPLIGTPDLRPLDIRRALQGGVDLDDASMIARLNAFERSCWTLFQAD